jgi:DNA end-binding protein Ku
MPHSIWKGSLSFGLVNIPVGLFPAESPDDLDLTLLDKRDLAPIGYNKVNKETGEPIAQSDIVRGYEVSDGKYVLLTDSDFKKANPKATQTVEIFGFLDAGAIPALYFDRPYYLAPLKQGQKPYALLREALERSGKVGLARLVIRTRQYLAAVYPFGDVLVVNLLRYPHELRDPAALDVPEGKTRLAPKEVELAEKLIAGMEEEWQPKQYKDEYRDDLLALIRKKSKNPRAVEAEPEPEAEPMAEVIDLMALLEKSVAQKSKGGARRAPSSSARSRTRAPAKPSRSSRSRTRKSA